MSLPDFKAVCDALAARYAPGTITTPSGATAMRKAYGQIPKAVPAVPAVVIEVQDGSVIADSSPWSHKWQIDALFLLSKRPGDPARVDAERQRWLPTLWSVTTGAFKLGIGAQVGYEIKSALPIGWSFTEYFVAGDEYDAIRINWEVWVYQTVAITGL